jgi:hypothetical protein
MSLYEELQAENKGKANIPKAEPKKSYLEQVGEGIVNIPQNIAKSTGERIGSIVSDIQNIPSYAEKAGGSPLDYLGAGIGAGVHTLGNIAGGANEAIGAVISPVIPEEAKKAIGGVTEEVSKTIDEALANIPNTTPEQQKEIKRYLEDVANIGTLYVGVKGTPKVAGAVEKGTKTITKEVGTLGEDIKDISNLAKEKGVGTFENIVKKPIPEQVKTSLSEVEAPLFDKYAKTAMKAAKSNKAKTPLEVAGESAQNALDTIQRKLQNIGKEKTDALNKGNVSGVQTGNIVLEMRQSLDNYGKNMLVKSDKALINDISSRAKSLGNNPTISQVDQFIDYVQDKLYTSKKDLTIPTTSKTPSFIRQLTGQLNSKLKEKAGKSYSGLNDKYSTLVQLRNELNTKLGVGGEKGGSLMKRVFSPSDANTKKLFEDIKKETGVDLVNEATMAKYVMEVAGDARQASLLEQLKLPKSSGDIVTKAMEMAWEKATQGFNTPEMIFKRAREKTKNANLPMSTRKIPPLE